MTRQEAQHIATDLEELRQHNRKMIRVLAALVAIGIAGMAYIQWLW